MELPSCLDCKHAGQGHPCRTADGAFDFAKVAASVIRYGRAISEDGEHLDDAECEANAWASDCAFEVEVDYPHLLLPLIVAEMDACETVKDAAVVAAGPLESAVSKHGPLLIDKIEALAAASPKFRYFLSAIWGERATEPTVWARVCKAVGSQGVMDDDGRCPSDGTPVRPLTGAEAAAVLQERVAGAAAALGL